MPLYEYLCDACEQRFELIQKFSDGAPEACPKCGKGPVHRQLSSPAFHLKGSGWYVTDYARKGSASPEGESSKGEGSKGEGSKGEGSTKTDTSAASSSSGDSGNEAKKSASTAATPAPAKPPAS